MLQDRQSQEGHRQSNYAPYSSQLALLPFSLPIKSLHTKHILYIPSSVPSPSSSSFSISTRDHTNKLSLRTWSLSLSETAGLIRHLHNQSLVLNEDVCRQNGIFIILQWNKVHVHHTFIVFLEKGVVADNVL